MGLYADDPFDFKDPESLDDRLPCYRVIFVNFATGGAVW
jgi:hypothetical protein